MKDTFIRLLRYLILFICILLVVSLVNNISRSRQMQKTLTEAQKSLDEIRNTQESLKQDLSIVESDFYAEKEARNKLGLVQENEVVIVLPDEEILKKLSTRKEIREDYQLPDSNWKKWVQLFL